MEMKKHKEVGERKGRGMGVEEEYSEKEEELRER
jgi:hypothetical protein